MINLIEYNKEFGIAVPEMNWVPSPSYILRRAAILECLKFYPPGRVLEVGCGAGALLYDIAKLGFHGMGIEISAYARALADKILRTTKGISVSEKLPKGEEGMFDYLLSFEVLEHIEDDVAALKQWMNFLKPGGYAFLSVPAHKNKWNITDSLVGHYRRYDRLDILTLVEGAGLKLISISTNGWPISRIIEKLRLIAKKVEIKKNNDKRCTELESGRIERTKMSGIDRRLETKFYPIYANRFGKMLFSVAFSVQRRFYSTDLGISYILVVRRPK